MFRYARGFRLIQKRQRRARLRAWFAQFPREWRKPLQAIIFTTAG